MLTVVQVVLLTVLLLAGGFADGLGFFHASRIWAEDGLQAGELARSALWLTFGIANYWLALYWARKLGVTSALIQTLVYFGATLVGVAVASRELDTWSLADKGLALVVAAGLGTLLVRHA